MKAPIKLMTQRFRLDDEVIYDGVALPFSTDLWIVVGVYLFVTGILSYAFEKGNNPDLQADVGERQHDGRLMTRCGKRLSQEQSASLNVFYWVLANFSGIGSACAPCLFPLSLTVA